MIIVPVKDGENIERALKKFKRKFERTGVIKGASLPSAVRQAFCEEASQDGARYLRTEAA